MTENVCEFGSVVGPIASISNDGDSCLYCSQVSSGYFCAVCLVEPDHKLVADLEPVFKQSIGKGRGVFLR